jgi:hypothetical protein
LKQWAPRIGVDTSLKLYSGAPFLSVSLRSVNAMTIHRSLCQSYARVLNGCVICCTGVRAEEKATLTCMALALGASVEKNFIKPVTHLLALATSSDKYRAAVRLSTRKSPTSFFLFKVYY